MNDVNISLLECPVCLDYYNNPQILTSCGHTVCNTCIKQLINNFSVACPLCNRLTNVTNIDDELKLNYVVQDMVTVLLNHKNSNPNVLSTSCPEVKIINETKIPVKKKIKDDNDLNNQQPKNVMLSNPTNLIFLMDEDIENKRDCCNIFST